MPTRLRTARLWKSFDPWKQYKAKLKESVEADKERGDVPQVVSVEPDEDA